MVEVNDAVQHLCGTNPFVDGAATLLVVFRIVVVALERRDGTTKHVDALLVGLADNLLIDVNDALGCLDAVLCATQVVDGLEEDNPLHALLSQQVALIAARCRRT